MKKKTLTSRKMSLCKETLKNLDEVQLQGPAGGTVIYTGRVICKATESGAVSRCCE